MGIHLCLFLDHPDAFVQAECAGIDQAAQRDNGQVFGTGMFHVNLRSDRDLAGSAEQILSDTGLSGVASYGTNMAYDSSSNQNIIREVLPMMIPDHL